MEKTRISFVVRLLKGVLIFPGT